MSPPGWVGEHPDQAADSTPVQLGWRNPTEQADTTPKMQAWKVTQTAPILIPAPSTGDWVQEPACGHVVTGTSRGPGWRIVTVAILTRGRQTLKANWSAGALS